MNDLGKHEEPGLGNEAVGRGEGQALPDERVGSTSIALGLASDADEGAHDGRLNLAEVRTGDGWPGVRTV